ncbi:CHY zinc finger domain-containing protein [Spironucleus salmonicida]|uniref:CHY zinc finger domain-containing protein n=1 Tax=Spironucleus salmonicida TaxID=348837 RepID=V6M2B0_9EUKA|nr:CHY zinc finger domain-containing protein [Spironucleus salmonicida]|eukprot:EST47364.1 CHY zinc finger domain-containing protein [Spironucleus salmonicida]
MNIDNFNSRHHNTVIIGTIFKLQPGTIVNTDILSHITLKTYYYDVYDQDRAAYWDTELSKIYHFSPLTIYNSFLTPFQLQNAKFSKEFTLLPFDEQIFLKFSLSNQIGCEHYICGCEQQCPDCMDFFGCRMCHSDETDHEFRRYDVNVIKCRQCDLVQKFSQYCTMCGLQFGKYCCLDCRLICDLGDENKPIFHSKDQNQCAIGIQAQSIYCDKCNWCYHMNYFADHQCRKSYGNCCCCLEDLDNSNKPKIALKCSHCIHLHCQQMILEGNDIKCPVCRKSMLCEEQIDDYKYQFQKLQDMYFFYSNQAVYGCYDCDERFEIFEHPVGVFCMYCQTPNCYLVERLHESFVDLKILTVEMFTGRILFSIQQQKILDQYLQQNKVLVNNSFVQFINSCINQQMQPDQVLLLLIQM